MPFPLIIQGDCLFKMREMEDCSIDFVVCDPPYGLNFMGKKWDGETPNSEIWKEVLRVCKPGSMLAAFGGTRTHHHLMIAIEQAGWEIRDCMMFLYGQGFPKSRRVSMFLDQYLQESDVCQCALSKQSSEYITPLQNVFDRICNLDIWKQAVSVEQNDLYDLKKVLGFQYDYQFDLHSYDEFLHQAANFLLSIFPSQEYVQGHNHFASLDDEKVVESLRILFEARYNDLLSKQDYLLLSFYQHVLQLLEAYKVDHDNASDLRKKLNKQQDFLISFHKMDEHKNPLNILDIFCLVFCLPFPLIKLLSTRKLSTILPWFNVCFQCNRLINTFHGYGTALKPAYEPIIIAMKPLDGTFAENAQKWGVAGINVDAGRIPTDENRSRQNGKGITFINGFKPFINESRKEGRWPSNLILNEEAAQALDEMSGISKSRPDNRNGINKKNKVAYGGKWKSFPIYLNDSGGASRFFYCAKASPRERGKDNHHPTVKPLSLMKYILKLLAPPGDPIVLDPFMGSGTTLLAAKELGIRAIGIELETEYCEIAERRIL